MSFSQQRTTPRTHGGASNDMDYDYLPTNGTLFPITDTEQADNVYEATRRIFSKHVKSECWKKVL
jgi:hypothetical protein